jgi:hypothetical protein
MWTKFAHFLNILEDSRDRSGGGVLCRTKNILNIKVTTVMALLYAVNAIGTWKT